MKTPILILNKICALIDMYFHRIFYSKKCIQVNSNYNPYRNTILYFPTQRKSSETMNYQHYRYIRKGWMVDNNSNNK